MPAGPAPTITTSSTSAVGWRGLAADALGNHVHAVASLVDGILDERQPAQFAGDKEVLHAGFVLLADHRNIRAGAWLGHDHGDSPHRAFFRAQAVADALMAIDDRGFAIDQGQHIAFRTGLHAGAASDAVAVIDPGMLRLGPVGEERPALQRSAHGGFFPLVGSPVEKKEETHNGSGNQPGEESVHLVKPHGYKSQAHDDRDVNHGQHGKAITEGTMNHMPKMKDALRLVQKDNPLGELGLLPDQPDDVFHIAVSAGEQPAR